MGLSLMEAGVEVEVGGEILGPCSETGVGVESGVGDVGGCRGDVGVTRVTVRLDESVRGGDGGAGRSLVLWDASADLLAGATGLTPSPGERRGVT